MLPGLVSLSRVSFSFEPCFPFQVTTANQKLFECTTSRRSHALRCSTCRIDGLARFIRITATTKQPKRPRIADETAAIQAGIKPAGDVWNIRYYRDSSCTSCIYRKSLETDLCWRRERRWGQHCHGGNDGSGCNRSSDRPKKWSGTQYLRT